MSDPLMSCPSMLTVREFDHAGFAEFLADASATEADCALWEAEIARVLNEGDGTASYSAATYSGLFSQLSAKRRAMAESGE